MTEVKAKLSKLTVSPYKVRLVADQIRGKRVEEAIDILSPARNLLPQMYLSFWSQQSQMPKTIKVWILTIFLSQKSELMNLLFLKESKQEQEEEQTEFKNAVVMST